MSWFNYRVVNSGNYIIDGKVNEDNLKRALKKISKKAFGNKSQEVSYKSFNKSPSEIY